MLGLLWFSAGALAGIKAGRHQTLSISYDETFGNEQLPMPSEGLMREIRRPLPRGGSVTVTQTIEPCARGYKASKKRVEIGSRAPVITRIVLATAMGLLTVMGPHAAVNRFSGYRDLDNRFDHIGLQQVWQGLNLGK